MRKSLVQNVCFGLCTSSLACVCFEGCGPQLELTGEEVNKQASHCNDRKTASKRIQELSSELFFGVFVKVTRPSAPRQIVSSQKRASLDGLRAPYGFSKNIKMRSVVRNIYISIRALGRCSGQTGCDGVDGGVMNSLPSLPSSLSLSLSLFPPDRKSTRLNSSHL